MMLVLIFFKVKYCILTHVYRNVDLAFLLPDLYHPSPVSHLFDWMSVFSLSVTAESLLLTLEDCSRFFSLEQCVWKD